MRWSPIQQNVCIWLMANNQSKCENNKLTPQFSITMIWIARIQWKEEKKIQLAKRQPNQPTQPYTNYISQFSRFSFNFSIFSYLGISHDQRTTSKSRIARITWKQVLFELSSSVDSCRNNSYKNTHTTIESMLKPSNTHNGRPNDMQKRIKNVKRLCMEIVLH